MAKLILVTESYKDYISVLSSHRYMHLQSRKKGQQETHQHSSGHIVSFDSKKDEYTILSKDGKTLHSGKGYRNLNVHLKGIHRNG